MQYHVFDLDGTVIDSRHRYATLPNGDIDLQHWRDHCTPEHIANDTLLPCANKMRRAFNNGHKVIVATSRIMQEADFAFLDQHGLFADAILFRPEGVNDGCADLKEFMLDEFFDGEGTCIEAETVIVYEDHMGVIDRLRARGAFCVVEGY